jgi:hypothetical protein
MSVIKRPHENFEEGDAWRYVKNSGGHAKSSIQEKRQDMLARGFA